MNQLRAAFFPFAIARSPAILLSPRIMYATMLHARKMLIVKRHTQLWNFLQAMRLQLSCVQVIHLRSQDLHRHCNFVDILLRQHRRMGCRDAIHERWLVLLRTQAEDGPPSIAEAHGANLLVLLSQDLGAIEDLGLAYLARVSHFINFDPFAV